MAEILAMSRSSLRRLLFRPRFWVSLLLALGCVLIVFFKVPPYLAERGYQVQAAEPFLILLPSFFPQILLLISFLLLVGDIPFLYPGMEITAIRSSRRKWLAAQVFVAMGAAVLWLLFLLACTLLVFWGHINFQNQWGVFLKALARSPGAMESVGMGLADAPTTHLFEGTTPYVRFGWLFLFQLLLLWSIALWSLAFNLWTRRSYGCMITVSFWVLRRVVNELALTTQKDFTRLSPMSLMDINQKPLDTAWIVYIVLFFVLQICILGLLSAIRLQREDLSKAG